MFWCGSHIGEKVNIFDEKITACILYLAVEKLCSD